LLALMHHDPERFGLSSPIHSRTDSLTWNGESNIHPAASVAETVTPNDFRALMIRALTRLSCGPV
jgi:hypothetical protein